MNRHGWIGVHADLTQKRQCVLAGVSRTTVYAKRKPVVFIEVDEVLKRLIDEEYTRHPFFGSRKMVVHLFRCGHRVNRKRVQRLMRAMFLAGMAPGPNTSDVFTDVLKRQGIAISMDGRGRAYDNIFVERLWRSVKHEDVYLNGYATMGELLIGLTKYFVFYNVERPHQSLGNQTPQEVHKTSSGGGAMIVNKYRTTERLTVALRSSGTAFEEVKIENESAIPNAKTGAAPSSCEKSSAT